MGYYLYDIFEDGRRWGGEDSVLVLSLFPRITSEWTTFHVTNGGFVAFGRCGRSKRTLPFVGSSQHSACACQTCFSSAERRIGEPLMITRLCFTLHVSEYLRATFEHTWLHMQASELWYLASRSEPSAGGGKNAASGPWSLRFSHHSSPETGSRSSPVVCILHRTHAVVVRTEGRVAFLAG